MPLLTRFFLGWEGSPTKIGYRKKGTLILSSPLEDLGKMDLLVLIVISGSQANPKSRYPAIFLSFLKPVTHIVGSQSFFLGF